ncbi:uncharacterized protein A4U43_C01F2320 [Asparagus officinalis]|uniref:Uncharacterized protein n=1 Tax=Asparagus officinalis TaxID=4686 RepID=A0A5P1FL48_ASPOF|nr:uncharacterized protein A4U43_C01F2320 [Asparagus officinalis]
MQRADMGPAGLLSGDGNCCEGAYEVMSPLFTLPQEMSFENSEKTPLRSHNFRPICDSASSLSTLSLASSSPSSSSPWHLPSNSVALPFATTDLELMLNLFDKIFSFKLAAIYSFLELVVILNFRFNLLSYFLLTLLLSLFIFPSNPIVYLSPSPSANTTNLELIPTSSTRSSPPISLPSSPLSMTQSCLFYSCRNCKIYVSMSENGRN